MDTRDHDGSARSRKVLRHCKLVGKSDRSTVRYGLDRDSRHDGRRCEMDARVIRVFQNRRAEDRQAQTMRDRNCSAYRFLWPFAVRHCDLTRHLTCR
jgi:hypothetical protein